VTQGSGEPAFNVAERIRVDGPTSGVDSLARREFWARINALAESGVTILVSTHFMDEANYCDRLVIMAEGGRRTSRPASGTRSGRTRPWGMSSSH
jgi:ABC-2 type transport system ATP-binding protein